MKRAHATALTLVNWKGVFFERYVLDRHVTALEGANGAGKTTVMIAAYVVLLPDLTRLKFVNLGETGSTGGDRGIYGRLGDPGPSYAAIEIEVGDGSRVLAGVYLERKAAPTLALTPFLVTEIGAAFNSEAFFLEQTPDHDAIRNPDELDAAATAGSAKLAWCTSSKEYFASLFERGISPLRLSLDEERTKFNEMLRTSMTGGISRTLTNDLRSFVLEQERGLFDTLSRMRKNLEACRKTRLEVGQARVLEQEISGIYAAGEAMFAAACEASERQAAEVRAALHDARAELDREQSSARELETRAEELALRAQSSRPRLERAREAERVLAERQARLERAVGAEQRLSELTRAHAALGPAVAAALERKEEAARGRERLKRERDERQAGLQRAAAGLASLQAGLEELHRRAHAFRRARAELTRVRELAEELGTSSSERLRLEPVEQLLEHASSLPSAAHEGATAPLASAAGELSQALLRAARAAVDGARRELDRERAERSRRTATLERARADYAEAHAALASLNGAPVEHGAAEAARRELARSHELELLASRVSELARDAERLGEVEKRREALLAELGALGVSPLPSAGEFVRELARLEADARAREREQHGAEQAARQHGERAEALRARQAALAARADRYRQLAAIGQRLQSLGEALPASAEALEIRLVELEEARRNSRAESERLGRERDEAQRLARELEAASAGPHQDLVRLAERVDGQLLARRYEDIDVASARRVEAELGPLAQAIVVENPARAVARVLQEPHELDTVWLLRAGAAWPLGAVDPTAIEALLATESAEQHDTSSTDVHEDGSDLAASAPRGKGARAASGARRDAEAACAVVDLGYGLRITRLPRTVSLGRAARTRRAEELRERAAQLGGRADQIEREQRARELVRQELELLARGWDSWALGDPGPELELCSAEIDAALAARTAEEGKAREHRLEVARLESRLAALRIVLGDHHLLDVTDARTRADEAKTSLERARGAEKELARTRAARDTLLRLLSCLDAPPPDAAELARWDEESARLDRERDQLFALAEALDALERQRLAFGWGDAERALGERTELVPELEAQHAAALADVERAQAAFEEQESEWERATAESQREAARLAALTAHLERARAERDREEIADASPEAVQQGLAELERARALVAELGREERGFEAELALQGERSREAARRVQAAEQRLAGEQARAEPAERQWRELAAAAQRVGGLALERAPAGEAGTATSALRWLEAQSKRELLADRLAAARGGGALAERAATLMGAGGLAPLALRYLELWQDVREWLLARLPAPLAELGDPLSGLSRLRSDLGELEGRLERQEGELRGTSGDVARSIEVQVRRAAARIRRLNHALDGISFGSVAAIRVHMERVSKMDGVLRALREGETQELLFQSNLPFEEALDEIFRRHAGGRTGGQKLVDYREYLELSVQIQRRSDPTWQRANPSQVSTGEAIGVGAALMMVILAEWERDEQLLRREQQRGSLRFLFLDEANRLSRDNLAVLFDLCRTLDLQLLIAAPEVARAEGNTTYHLVRRVSDDGREEVLVTGRRASLPEAAAHPHPAPNGHDAATPAATDAAALPAAPVAEQRELFSA